MLNSVFCSLLVALCDGKLYDSHTSVLVIGLFATTIILLNRLILIYKIFETSTGIIKHFQNSPQNRILLKTMPYHVKALFLLRFTKPEGNSADV